MTDKCESCGVPFIDHLGLVGTCKRLQEANYWRHNYSQAVKEAERERDAAIAAKEKAESVVANRCAACGGTTVNGRCGWCERFDAAIARAERERKALRSQLHDGHRWTKIRDERDSLQARVRDLEEDRSALIAREATQANRADALQARLAVMTALLRDIRVMDSIWEANARIDAALKAAGEGML